MPDIRDKIYLDRISSEPSPIIDEPWVTILFRGQAEVVELIGEMTGWQPRGLYLKPIAGTDVRYYAMPFLNDARIEYKLLINGEWQLDGLNPNRAQNELGGLNSYFLMPRYKPNPWAEKVADNPCGRRESFSSDSPHIQVYLPPGYEAVNEAFPTLYFVNGQEYSRNLPVDIIVDNLLAAQLIRPFLMVFVETEGDLNDDRVVYHSLDRIVNELIPSIEARYQTARTAESRAIAGSGLGGATAARAACIYPEVFGKVLSQSAAFSPHHLQFFVEALSQQHKKLEWYLEVGRYEALLEINRRINDILDSNSQRVGYRELSAGHNWTHWKDGLSEALTFLFPYSRK